MLLKGDFGELTKEQKAILARSSENVEKLMTTIQDVLVMSHVEHYTYTFNSMDVQTIIKDVLQELEPEAQNKNVRVVWNDTDTAKTKVIADRSKIYIVVENLIENAIRYTNSGGTITITTAAEAEGVHLSFKDTGIGISLEDESKIFTRFWRGNNAMASYPHGSGIGLYVSKNIIDVHKGKLWFERGSDGGTIFHITLPYKPKES